MRSNITLAITITTCLVLNTLALLVLLSNHSQCLELPNYTYAIFFVTVYECYLTYHLLKLLEALPE